MNFTINEFKKICKDCGFGITENCCNICFLGPCRLDPFKENQKGKCGFDRLQITISDFLIKNLYQLGKIMEDDVCFKSFIQNAENVDIKNMKNININENIINSLKWISKSEKADYREGVNLFLTISQILLVYDFYRYKKDNTKNKVFFIDESIFWAKYNSSNIKEIISKDIIKNQIQTSKEFIISLFEATDFSNLKNEIVIINESSDDNLWPVLCGFAAFGFKIVTNLPAAVKANYRILNVMNEVLYENSGGKIIELS